VKDSSSSSIKTCRNPHDAQLHCIRPHRHPHQQWYKNDLLAPQLDHQGRGQLVVTVAVILFLNDILLLQQEGTEQQRHP
jgi:hypothetical protein